MFQPPKDTKSGFSQLPSFGQIANNLLQTGNPSTSPSPFTTMSTFPGTTSRSESSSFKNPPVFSTSSFPTGSVLFADQTKNPTSVAVSLASNPFASVTNTNPLAGIFGTGPTQSPSFSSTPAPPPAFTSSTTPGSSTIPFTSSGAFGGSTTAFTPSGAFGNSATPGGSTIPFTSSTTFGSSNRTESSSSIQSNFGVGSATSASGSVPVFGQQSSMASSGKSNPFSPSSVGVFQTPSAETSIQTQSSFNTNKFVSSSEAHAFSSQISPKKSEAPAPSWGAPPSEPPKTNLFVGTTSSSVGSSFTGSKSFGGSAPVPNLFQAPAAKSTPNLFQASMGSSAFSSSTVTTNSSIGSASYKAFSSTADSTPQKAPPVTSSAFLPSPSIGQTVSKIFGSTSEGAFSRAKETKTETIGLFGMPIDPKPNLTQASSSGFEIPKVSSGLFGKPEKKVEPEPTGLFGKPEKKIKPEPTGLFGKPERKIYDESSGVPVSQPVKVGLFGKPLTQSEIEAEESGTRKRSVSPKRSWAGRHEKELRSRSSLSTRGSKPFGRLYSEIDEGPELASSRLFQNQEKAVEKPRDQSRPSRRTAFPRQISEDDESKVAVICRNVPSNYNRGTFLRKHFSRFGEIARVKPNPQQRSANIHFKHHESASRAKYEGAVLAPGVRIQIFWHAGTRRTSTSYRDLDAAPTDPDVGDVSPPQHTPATSPKKRSWMRNEVDEELQMMAGTQDIKEDFVHTLDRPDEAPFIAPPPLAPTSTAPTSSVSSRPSRSLGHRPRTLPGGASQSSAAPDKKVSVSTAEVKKAGSMAPPKSTPSLPLRKTDITTAATLNELETSLAAARVKLLNLYDLAVRKQLKKRPLAADTALVGTCPDMCPEKERYDREAKRRLHVFEILEGTENLPYPKANHARVVKEYSRSSADQEEPLPHALRPATVLLRTMTYLLAEIANKGQDGCWTEWYDFLWDRMRGIRKDITQQNMCNVEAVVMLEKCVRFHIFSAERLCEEDMSTFSHKINDENLTKCLQSLKYLYADMERKNKIYFSTESEFRAYVVLMNLNEGDMLREVQTLRPDILGSPEIHFALQVYTAINSNNYIKFFKLIRKATFLNSCILHRYFSQVRSKALMILMRALSSSSRPVPFPLPKLVETLGFESTTQAATFCRHYGFLIEDNDVLLDRASFVEPETAPEPQRSKQLVESKCNGAIGEIINGSPLPPYELLTPNSSFDKDGNLKTEMMARNVMKEKFGPVAELKVISEDVTPAATAAAAEIPFSSQPFTALPQRPFSPYQSQPVFVPEPQTQQEPSSFQEQQPSPLQQQEQEQQQPSPKPFQQIELPEQPKMVEESQSQRPPPPFGGFAAPQPPQTPVAEVSAVQAPNPSHMKQLTLDIIKELARDMFLDVIKEFATSIAEESLQDTRTLKSIAAEVFQETQHTVVDGLLREVSHQVREEEMIEQHRAMERLAQEEKFCEERRKAEEAARKAAEASLQKRKEQEAAEAKRLAEERRKLAEQKEREESEKRVAEGIVDEIIEAFIENEVKLVSDEQMEQVEEELKEKTILECSHETKTEILHEVIDEMCSEIGQEVYTTDVELRLKELQELEHCVKLYRMSKLLRQWRKACIVQQQRRYSLQTFPACPSWNSSNDQIKRLCGREHRGIVDEAIVLNKRARLSIESPIAISRRDAYLPAALTLCRLRRHLTQQKAWYPLDLKTTVGKELLASSNWVVPDLFNSSVKRNEDRLYWKLLISFPELDEEADDVFTLSSLELCDWLKSKLTKGARPESTIDDDDKISILSLYKTQLNEQASSLSARKMLNFCARSVTGILSNEDIEQIETDKLFLGSSGLLYILPVMQISPQGHIETEDEEMYWLEEQTRLATLLQAKPIKPSLPLAIVMPRHRKLAELPLKELIKKMNLQNFIDQELISSVSLFTLPFCMKTPGIDVEHYIAEDRLNGSMKWLASRIPKQLLLEKKRFKDYVEDFLSQEFYGPVLYNQKIRLEEGYLQQSPHVIIDLYNSVIDHLTACATDKELLKYSWPVTEFLTSTDNYDLPSIYWNSEEHLVEIGNQLLLLKLPEFISITDWSEEWSKAIEDAWNYIKIIIGDDSQNQAVELVSKVRNLLVRTETRFSEACLLEYGQEDCLPTAENMVWLDIILFCINHRLMTTSCLDTSSSLDDQECPKEMDVVYRKSALNSFKPDLAWRDAASERNMREGPTLKSTYIQSVNQKAQSKKEQLLGPPRTAQISFTLDPDFMTTNTKSIDLLKTSLNSEKQSSNHFEDYLERSLQEGYFTDETTFMNFHSGGAGDVSTILSGNVDQSIKGDPYYTDELDPDNKSMEDEFLLDFEAAQSLEDKIIMLKNELESCRKADDFMECCLNSLAVDPYYGGMDHDEKNTDTETNQL